MELHHCMRGQSRHNPEQIMIDSTEKSNEKHATLSISLMTPSSMSTTIALACQIFNQLSYWAIKGLWLRIAR